MVMFLIIGIVILGGLGVIGIISYRALQRLSGRHDKIIRGRKQSEIAEGVRARLIAEYGAREVSFSSLDGTALAGLLVVREAPRLLVVAAHGYRQNKEVLSRFPAIFPDATLLFFDFRAHGQSGGAWITSGHREADDVKAACAFLRASVNKELPLIVAGISMGGVAALKAAAEDETLCDAVIADSVYDDLRLPVKLTFKERAALPVFPFYFFVAVLARWYVGFSLTLRPIDLVKKIHIPLLFIHSCVDDITPLAGALRIFSVASKTSSCAQLWVGPAVQHGFLNKTHQESYAAVVHSFVDALL